MLCWVPLRNSDVKRTLMSNADVHYEFNRFKLDTTFTTHLSFLFVSCIVHRPQYGKIQYTDAPDEMPCLLPNEAK
jgi:hypothetical protein